MRLALGAGRGELFRQLLTESLILVTAGGALAWGFAEMATRLLGRWAQIESSLAPDRTVLLFTLGVLVLAALAVWPGAAASCACRRSGAGAEDVGCDIQRRRGQIAHRQNRCRAADGAVRGAAGGRGPADSHPAQSRKHSAGNAGRRSGCLRREAEHSVDSGGRGVLSEPDEQAARSARRGIGDHHGGASWIVVVRQQRHDGGRHACRTWPTADRERSAATWRGRTSSPRSACRCLRAAILPTPTLRTSPHVGIINEEFAKRFLPNQNPLGHTIGTDDGRYTMTIVGVVKDHKYRSIDEEPIPMAWYMYAQIPMIGAMNVEMRVHGEPLAILPAARKVVQQLDPNLPLIKPMTQRAQFDTTISSQMLFARLAGFFGFLAVVLVATGLYGTLAYRVSMRTAEIGVRMAVGARRGQVVWMILRDSLLLTAVGVVDGRSARDAGGTRAGLVSLWREAAGCA